jgi:hypothetical protein
MVDLFPSVSIFVGWQKRICSLIFEFMVWYLQMTFILVYAFRCSLHLVILLNQRIARKCEVNE